VRIVGIAGSLRAGSFNAALLRAAVEECPEQATLAIESIRLRWRRRGRAGDSGACGGAEGAHCRRGRASPRHPRVQQLDSGRVQERDRLADTAPADVPRVFKGRAVGLIGASPGAFGTVLSQAAWLPVFRTLGMQPYFGQLLYVGGAGKVFDASGRLADDAIRARLRKYLEGFVEFVAG
jgi:NAD(P)H-dependent FMN reductase